MVKSIKENISPQHKYKHKTISNKTISKREIKPNMMIYSVSLMKLLLALLHFPSFRLESYNKLPIRQRKPYNVAYNVYRY